MPAGCLVNAAEHERFAAGEFRSLLLEPVEAASDHGDRLVVKVAVGARPGGEAPLAAIPRVLRLVGDEEPGDGRAACDWTGLVQGVVTLHEHIERGELTLVEDGVRGEMGLRCAHVASFLMRWPLRWVALWAVFRACVRVAELFRIEN